MRLTTFRSAGVLVFLILLVSAATAQVIVKDEKTFFDTVIPADWTVSRPTDAQEAEVLRYQAIAPDKLRGIYFYVIETHDDIDLGKFENIDSHLGWNLGQLSSERRISESVSERRYKRGPKGLYAVARFQVEGPNGYVVFAASASPDLSFADGVFQTFIVKVPITTRLSWWFVRNRDRLGGLFWWIIGIIVIVGGSLLFEIARRVFGSRPVLDDVGQMFARIMEITHLPEKRQAVLVDRFHKILNRRVKERLRTALNTNDYKKFVDLTAAASNDGATTSFLLERGVDVINKVLPEETRKLCEDVRRKAVKLNTAEEVRNLLSQVELASVVEAALEAADAMSEATDN